jgi:hypothetical protein
MADRQRTRGEIVIILALFLHITADPPTVEEHEIKPPPETSPY